MIESLLDRTGALQRQTAVKDAVGGNTPTWATVSGLGTVACAIGPASWVTTKNLNRPDMIVQSEIYTAIDVGAKENDRWLINGSYYLVLAYLPYVNPIFGPACYVSVCGKRNQT